MYCSRFPTSKIVV